MKPEVVASMKSGFLGCLRTCSRGPSIVVVGSEVREEGNGCETAEGSRLYEGTTFRLQVYGCLHD